MRENHERPQQPAENEKVEDEVEQLFMIQMTDPNIIDQLWLCLSLNHYKNFVLLMTYFKGSILKIPANETRELADFLGCDRISFTVVYDALRKTTPNDFNSLRKFIIY